MTSRSGHISVAMTTCNGERFLAQQLKSIMEQSVVPDEVVICDDASTDGTGEILTEWRRRYPARIKLFFNPERLGVAKNFEQAIGATRGDIVFLADQDDFWQPDKVAKMRDLILRAPHPVGVFSNSMVVDGNLNPTGRDHWRNRGFPEALSEILADGWKQRLSIFLKRVPAAGHDMAFHAELKSVLLPFPDLPECHDTWIGLTLAALDRWSFTREELTLFRQHKENLSGSGAAWNWKRRWSEARESIRRNTFDWNARLYRSLIERIGGQCTPEVRALLEERAEHSQRRAAMDGGFFHRIPLVMKELFNRRYFRYARGWPSVIQDLFLR